MARSGYYAWRKRPPSAQAQRRAELTDRIDSRLVVDAIQMAILRELPGEGLIAHSDRGAQYASEHYQTLLRKHAVTCSMSRKGNCREARPVRRAIARMKDRPR